MGSKKSTSSRKTSPKKRQAPCEIQYKTYTWTPPPQLRTQLEDILKEQERCRKKRNREIRELAIFLEGLSKGQGNMLPLGKSHLESLWSGLGELERTIPAPPRSHHLNSTIHLGLQKKK